MYIAELKGKIPADVEKMEDILTSNVFSFFKYSRRNIYLKIFLSKLGIIVTDNELNEAEFIFWPTYDDGTEPDVVIIVSEYYLLFESKYYSDFGRKTITTDYQLIREAKGGLIASQKEDKTFQEQLIREAKEGPRASKNIGKKFYLIAITADYYYKPYKFEVIKDFPIHLRWINWQTVAELILNLIEENQEKLPDYLFAMDLYQLLDKKQLRAFRSFIFLRDIFISEVEDDLFFSAETAKFRGKFIGFQKLFSALSYLEKPSEIIFFSSSFKK